MTGPRVLGHVVDGAFVAEVKLPDEVAGERLLTGYDPAGLTRAQVTAAGGRRYCLPTQHDFTDTDAASGWRPLDGHTVVPVLYCRRCGETRHLEVTP